MRESDASFFLWLLLIDLFPDIWSLRAAFCFSPVSLSARDLLCTQMANLQGNGQTVRSQTRQTVMLVQCVCVHVWVCWILIDNIKFSTRTHTNPSTLTPNWIHFPTSARGKCYLQPTKTNLEQNKWCTWPIDRRWNLWSLIVRFISLFWQRVNRLNSRNVVEHCLSQG